jgi:DNA/RNA-binding protein KIN17
MKLRKAGSLPGLIAARRLSLKLYVLASCFSFTLHYLNTKYQEASLKKDRATVSDEQREQQLIAEQISRAAVEDDSKSNDSSTPPVEEGLKRDEISEKVVLSFSAKPIASSGSASVVVSTGVKINPLKAAVNPLKANPLKRPNNVFKSSALTTLESGVTTVNEKKRPAPMSAAERLIVEEQERKRRRMDRDNMA